MSALVRELWLRRRSEASAIVDRYLVELRRSGNLVGTLKGQDGPGGPYVECINALADLVDSGGQMIYRPKVARDAASILTPQQADAIERTRIVCSSREMAEASMLLRLGISIELDGKEFDADEYADTHDSANDLYPDAEGR